jgi:hypothetical protein
MSVVVQCFSATLSLLAYKQSTSAEAYPGEVWSPSSPVLGKRLPRVASGNGRENLGLPSQATQRLR